MRINIERVLNNLDGSPLKSSDNTNLTVGDILSTCALSAPAQGGNYTPDQQVQRYNLAIDIKLAREGDGFLEITSDQATMFKADVARMFAPIAAGQVLPLLDGQ